MPIDDDDNIGQFVVYDTDTDEYTALAPLDESPELEAEPGSFIGRINNLKGSITMAGRAAAKSVIAFAMLRRAILEWSLNNALQSGDRRKIKRAKRNYKAAKRELRRRLLQDDG